MSQPLTIPQCNCGGNSWTGVSASPVIIRCDSCGALAAMVTRVPAFGEGIASAANRPVGPPHYPVHVQQDWPDTFNSVAKEVVRATRIAKAADAITVNVSAPWFGDPHEVAKAIWKHAGRPERAITFRRIFGFIAEFSRLQVAYDAASLSRPGLTRGDWLAMRGGK